MGQQTLGKLMRQVEIQNQALEANNLVRGVLCLVFIASLAALSFLVLLAYQLPAAARAASPNPVQSVLEEESLPVENPAPASDETIEETTSETEDPTSSLTEIPEALTAEKFYFGEYVYEAQAGDNLTYFARRSVQLYVAEETQINLETSQVIAAETHIVQDLGAFELAIGQEVGIDVALVASHVETARGLDETAKACWAAYEPVRENLSSISPVQLPQSISLDTQADQTADPDGSDDNGADVTTADDEGKNAIAESDSSFYLIFFAALALATIGGWILIIVQRQNSRKDSSLSWELEKEGARKGKLADSAIARKAKALPKALAEQKAKLKKRGRPVGSGDKKKRKRRLKRER